MRLNFVYSGVYYDMLNKYSHGSYSWADVKRLGEEFEKEYSADIDRILIEIPKVMNKNWDSNTVEVYPMSWRGPSFSHPLTLKVREDKLLMLVILAHELLHSFFMDRSHSEEEQVEREINDAVRKVFDNLDIDASSQFVIMQGMHDSRYSSEKHQQ